MSDTSTDSGMCPMPASTKVWEVSDIKSCSELDTQYRAMAQEARRCNCDADCREEVAKDFCGCTIAVNPGNDAYTFLKPAFDHYTSMGCSTVCPLSICLPAVKYRCVASSGGKFCAESGSVVTP